MKKGQMLAVAGGLVAAALTGGTLISATLAAPTAVSSAGRVSTGLGVGEYCDVYVDALAGELGVERADLGAASKAAMNAVIDAAVADGEIDEEDATQLREEIAELEDTDCEAFGPRLRGGGSRGGPHAGFGLRFGDALEAAATALNLEDDEVTEALRDGTTLQELAETQGVAYDSVTSAVTSAVQAELDDAVADGDITQERADEILENVQDWLADGGEPFRRGPRGGGRFGG